MPHEGDEVQIKGTRDRFLGGFNHTFAADDFWFTRKEDTVYVIALGRPADGRIAVKAIKGLAIRSIRLLGTTGDLSWAETPDAVEINLPAWSDDGLGYALEITC
ncbi:MAG TPA: hypothetical protein DCR55_08775 [Lentisphaeria bacterium]|nr:hypothetical protein [Lentisphaeria bacterium]